MRLKISYSFILTLCIIWLVSLFSLGGKSEWTTVKEGFIKDCKSDSDSTRISVTGKLVGSIYPEVEPEAANLLIEQIGNELSRDTLTLKDVPTPKRDPRLPPPPARNPNDKREELVNIKVIDKCIEGIRKMTNEKAVSLLVKKASTRGTAWRYRFYIIKALGGINNPDVIKSLVSLIKDPESTIQMAAVDALGDLRSPEGIEPACKLLTSKVIWEVKLAVVDYLRKIKSPESVKYVREAIHDKDTEPRIISALMGLLTELTQNTTPDSVNLGKSGETKSHYYGIEIESDRIIFIMDVSGSMSLPAKEREKLVETGAPKLITTGDGKSAPKIPQQLIDKKKDVDNREAKTRIDSAKRELINTIYSLSPKTRFTIVFYSTEFTVWRDELILATYENKLEAIKIVDSQSPEGATNIYDALESAYKLGGSTSPTEPKRVITGGGTKVEKADTIFLLTDGNANTGKIPDAAGIIEAVRKINEIRRVKINTIAIGIPDPNNPQSDKGADTGLMKQIAEITGGTFVDQTK